MFEGRQHILNSFILFFKKEKQCFIYWFSFRPLKSWSEIQARFFILKKRTLQKTPNKYHMKFNKPIFNPKTPLTLSKTQH